MDAKREYKMRAWMFHCYVLHASSAQINANTFYTANAWVEDACKTKEIA
jgi:hypothetical protein